MRPGSRRYALGLIAREHGIITRGVRPLFDYGYQKALRGYA
jgi:hypothetical protein